MPSTKEDDFIEPKKKKRVESSNHSRCGRQIHTISMTNWFLKLTKMLAIMTRRSNHNRRERRINHTMQTIQSKPPRNG